MKNGFMISNLTPQTNPANGVALLLSTTPCVIFTQTTGKRAGQRGSWLTSVTSDLQKSTQTATRVNLTGRMQHEDNSEQDLFAISAIEMLDPAFSNSAHRLCDYRTGGYPFVLA